MHIVGFDLASFIFGAISAIFALGLSFVLVAIRAAKEKHDGKNSKF